jgi:phage terminase small subunit
MQEIKKPPKHLSRKAKSWFNSIASQFEFGSEAEWSLLEQAAGCLDRIDQAREEIVEHGLLVPTGNGSFKPNPATNIERDNRILFARLLRELRLNEPPTDDRPPRISNMR